MHMGIPVCVRAGIAKIFAYGDPITHNEVVRIWGLTYTWLTDSWLFVFLENDESPGGLIIFVPTTDDALRF